MLAVVQPKARSFVVAIWQLLGNRAAAVQQLLPLYLRESTAPLAYDFV